MFWPLAAIIEISGSFVEHWAGAIGMFGIDDQPFNSDSQSLGPGEITFGDGASIPPQ
ncbi:uncharacterized protein TrAFT101_003821 [Trichoderma asperellum]|uniref:uncharacterized protein n=1 Tax=Trichoderma asperellum TaxID=101201 RepID=UPI003324CD65|nr:hypothetical protein TrAFT101_003821 [Trichoderma asperellum]